MTRTEEMGAWLKSRRDSKARIKLIKAGRNLIASIEKFGSALENRHGKLNAVERGQVDAAKIKIAHAAGLGDAKKEGVL